MQPTHIPGPNPRRTAPHIPGRPGAMPQLSADSRPGHPRNAAAHKPEVRFTDWALI